MKQCPKCVKTKFAFALFLNKDFCPDCGTKLEPCPKCVRCDAEITPNDNFCTKCGLPRANALKKKN